jgi:serine/threonine protein kinase
VVRRRKNRTTLRLEDQLEIQKFQVQPNLFSYAELKAATRSFDPGNKIGEGGYGVVYKGVLADGTEVAVKTLSAKSYQGKQEFLNEAALITAVQHRSLVKLKGCCLERDHRILVYEFMENKSLHQTLFGARAMPMDWPTRFNIALGTARGLAYLHEESEARIVHRDIKASNILLDRNFNPKISDFGMARLFEDHQSHVSTRVAGTLGYVAPEYALLGQLTEKADVFSYGIVLLELVSGRFNIRTDIRGEQAYLLEWAWKLEAEDNLLYVMDGKLLDTYVEDEVLRVLHVALLCTQAVASTRPCMTRVVAMLLGDIELPPITSGPGFMVGLMHSETPSHSTSSSFLTNSSGFRGKESTPLFQLSETRTKSDMEMYPR